MLTIKRLSIHWKNVAPTPHTTESIRWLVKGNSGQQHARQTLDLLQSGVTGSTHNLIEESDSHTAMVSNFHCTKFKQFFYHLTFSQYARFQATKILIEIIIKKSAWWAVLPSSLKFITARAVWHPQTLTWRSPIHRNHIDPFMSRQRIRSLEVLRSLISPTASIIYPISIVEILRVTRNRLSPSYRDASFEKKKLVKMMWIYFSRCFVCQCALY